MKRTPRLISLGASFCPSGENLQVRIDKFIAFQDFCRDAESQLRTLKQRDLARKMKRLPALLKAISRVAPVMMDVGAGRASSKEAAIAIRKLVPDEEVRKELFELYEAELAAKPQDAKSVQQTAGKKIDYARRKKLAKAIDAIGMGFSHLTTSIGAGDAEAARELAEAAIQANRLLSLCEAFRPELFRQIAKRLPEWPVLADGDKGWEKEAVERIAKLGVGDDLVIFKARFRPARGCDANHPARRWAKASVRTLEATRVQFYRFAHFVRNFGSPEALGDFCVKNGWERRPAPEWSRKAWALETFTKVSIKQWAGVIKEMIREQIPDFHLRPEWQNQRNAAKTRSKGVLQNRILDDICDALETIAPNPNGPLCGNSTAEVP